MSGPLPLNFVQSAARCEQLPHSDVELALVGRSNVGKSSLLNALANRKALARTSKTPGATKLLNAFSLDDHPPLRWIVDLPGYGFAKVSRQEQDRMSTMINDYLLERESLVGVLVLIDGEVGPTALDLQTVDWLRHIDLPLHLVATKSDKVRPSKSKRRRNDLVAKLGVAKGDVRWVSAAKGTGVQELRLAILEWLEP